jgi:hypothetical protein
MQKVVKKIFVENPVVEQLYCQTYKLSKYKFVEHTFCHSYKLSSIYFVKYTSCLQFYKLSNVFGCSFLVTHVSKPKLKPQGAPMVCGSLLKNSSTDAPSGR